jgi:AcrR family transcriptional regulator
MNAKDIREQAVRDAKEGLILDAALKVFAEKGFHNARLEDIAFAAGFSKASLYNYYKDKEGIFVSLGLREYHKLLEKLQHIANQRTNMTAMLKECLIVTLSAMGEHFAIILAMSDFGVTDCQEIERLHTNHHARFQEFRELFVQIQKLFIDILMHGRVQGLVRDDIDLGYLGRYVGALIRGVFFDWKIDGKMGNVHEDSERILLFLQGGLQPSITQNSI